MYILCIAVLVIAVVVIFSVQNAVPVSVAFLTWKFGASLAVIVFLAFVVGIAVTALSSPRVPLERRGPAKGTESRIAEGTPRYLLAAINWRS